MGRLTLSFQILALVLTVQVLVFGSGGWMLVGLFSDRAEQEVRERLLAPGRLMQQGGLSLRAAGDAAVMGALVGDTLRHSMLVGRNGTILQSLKPEELGQPLQRHYPRLAARSWQNMTSANLSPLPEAGDTAVLSIIPMAFPDTGPPVYFLFLSADLSVVVDSQRQAVGTIVITLTVTSLLMAALMTVLIRTSVLRPVRELSQMVQQIGQGDLQARCPRSLPREMLALGRGLDAMAASIQANDHAIRTMNVDLAEKYAAQTQNLQHELSMRRTTEEQLRQARDLAQQALVEKSRFLAAASHDLRQPVHALRLLIGAALEHSRGRDSELTALLRDMRQSGNNLSDMLNSLLDVSRLEAGVIVPLVSTFPLRGMMMELEQEFRRVADQTDVRLEVVISSCLVRSDRDLLKRIIANLLSNAIKFSPGGAVLLGCRRRLDQVEIMVCDTGIGIPADQIDGIFDEFRQLDNEARQSRKGLGLGLSIVRRVAALLAHPLQVQSDVGRGTCFSVFVPQIRSGN